MLQEALERVGLSLSEVMDSGQLAELAKAYHLQSADDLLAAIGWGSVSVQSVVNKLKPPQPKPRVTIAQPAEIEVLPTRKGTLLYRLAKCCTPVPNDPIIGYISRGRGIIVHRRDCRNILRLQEIEPERLISLNWGFPLNEPVIARIRVIAYDRIGLLSDVSNAVSSRGVSIVSNRSTTNKDGIAFFEIGVVISEEKTLQEVMDSISRLTDVIQVTRII